MSDEDGELSSVRRNGKSEAAFRTISEVADELDVPQHVLRFWEGKFPQVKPLKRGGGRRYYRPDDVALLRRIRDLLYSEGYTIKGVQKLLKEGGATQPREASAATPSERELDLMLDIHDPDPPGAEEADEMDHAVPEPEAARAAPVAGAASREGGLSPDMKAQLEDLMDELQQMRSLLQPR
jgi:DNA-binding transcriptional MerR regulator